ncbi:hypothetical protein NLX83_00530 [Allokutzneria sp. A3M-2-11 16]|uniref:hypothetical protein n=1 Tax=Allokutzneria sp. A3M-2-11 16 TaxID=2962043 RepID=UPI0020B82A34|nr:hypothetical protein [Allokutzneria sp. A3M-2-11 16]MCP3797734.1 hypothetical protein [Allokutzneria sp. A3M-2-11 16]
MGTTATWVFELADGEATSPGWEPVEGLRPGWSGAMGAAPAEAPGRPALVISVWDSGFCLLDAVGHWRWVINDEPFAVEADPHALAEYGLTVDEAERRRRVVPLMVAWAEEVGLPTPDAERLDEVLDRQYVPAETGLFALLDVLGILPAPERPAVVFEPLPEPEQEVVDLWPIERSGPRFAFQVDTYADLFTRLDAVVNWLNRLREAFPGPVTVSTVSVKQRYRNVDGSLWKRVLRDVMKGQLANVSVSVPGTGWFAVELRSPLVDEPTGPLPNGFPAHFAAQVDRPAAAETPELLADLLRTTAATFGAVSGFLTADTVGMLGTYAVNASPYESRSVANTHPYRRLDEITRGVHWGNVWTSGHLAAVGGASALRESGAFARVEPIVDSDLWWLQLTADPDELEHAHVDRAAWVARAVMPRRPNGNIGLTAQ